MAQAGSATEPLKPFAGILSRRGGLGMVVEGSRSGTPSCIAMALQAERSGFGLHILDGSGRPLLRLGPYAEEDVLAEWHRLGAVTGLPLTLLFPNGSVLALFDQMGPVRCGQARIPTRRTVLNGRRPRSLSRRKTGLPAGRREAETTPV
jgi:hypothetical protein